ncbi:MAG: phosphatidate cytidylyltransferase [Candidatus Phytoplasma australasiaticum]|nr:phosphatidate cytidylyltransferase [Candidatus Phytoplasma australasiaticum]MDV3199847.1 phosphatidate cytidylyltransferase [Candidatus Phytoplasma australasiaticum]
MSLNIKKIKKKIYVGITILTITIIWLSILIYIDKNQKTDLLIYNGILFLITFIYLSFREVIKKIKIPSYPNQIIKFNNKKNISNLLFFFIFNIVYGFYLIKIILKHLYHQQIIKIQNRPILHNYIKKIFFLNNINLNNNSNNSIILFIFLMIICFLYIYFINQKKFKTIQLSYTLNYLIIIKVLCFLISNMNNFIMINIPLYIIFCYIFFFIYKNNYLVYNELFKNIAIFIYILLGSISIFSLMLINPKIILYLFIITISSDSFAFLGGVFWGKKLLCHDISPNKTKEGFICGILFTIIIINTFFNVMNKISYFIVLLILTIISSIISQIGDLIVSKFKRNLDIKDFSNFIPEHGGLLDRFDSILFLSIFMILIIINPWSQLIHQLFYII